VSARDGREHNADKTCWNCPAIDLAGKVDFRACGQTTESFDKNVPGGDVQIMAECKRRPELGVFDPTTVTFAECPEWESGPYGYVLKGMRVMILGMDGYLGWPLALRLGRLGYRRWTSIGSGSGSASSSTRSDRRRSSIWRSVRRRRTA